MARIERFLFQKGNSEYTEKSKVNTSTTQVHEAGHYLFQQLQPKKSHELATHNIHPNSIQQTPKSTKFIKKKNLQNSYQSLLSYINTLLLHFYLQICISKGG